MKAEGRLVIDQKAIGNLQTGVLTHKENINKLAASRYDRRTKPWNGKTAKARS